MRSLRMLEVVPLIIPNAADHAIITKLDFHMTNLLSKFIARPYVGCYLLAEACYYWQLYSTLKNAPEELILPNCMKMSSLINWTFFSSLN